MTARKSGGSEYYRKYDRLNNKMKDAGVPFGGGGRQMVMGLPDEIQDWLIGQAPEGSTLNEVIGAIITDAFHDDMDTRK